MRILRFVDSHGRTRHGVEAAAGKAHPISGDLYGDFTVGDETTQVTELLAPIVPSNIYCIGLNYREHAEESGAPLPEQPVVFMKPTSTLAHPGAPILLPKVQHDSEVDYECELAVVIGKDCRDVSEDDALDYVLGYTAAHDVSARTWQLHGGGGQWIRGKGFDTFCPLGPVLVTADEIPDPQALRLKTELNGKIMQDHTTGDMIFTVRQIIAFLSQDTTLLAGTVILTGTPQGVGFARQPPVWLKAGDQVVIEVEKIGRLINPVIDA